MSIYVQVYTEQGLKPLCEIIITRLKKKMYEVRSKVLIRFTGL